MNKRYLLAGLLIPIAAGVYISTSQPLGPEPEIHGAGETFLTSIESENIGSIAIKVQLPVKPRYENGSPILVVVPTSFTPDLGVYNTLEGADQLGVTEISLLFPGRSAKEDGQSDGENDYGGEQSLQALKDVILFAGGKIPNSDGFDLQTLSSIPLATDNVGIYAFSHPGIAATQALAKYPEELDFVSYFVGRENPTEPAISSMEIGYFNSEGEPVFNPEYAYPNDYSPDHLKLEYDSVRYNFTTGVPYWDINRNKTPDKNDYASGKQVPQMFGKRMYSPELLKALQDNEIFEDKDWPADLASPEEATEWWKDRSALSAYELLRDGSPQFHVMLVFGARDHVQVVGDKPHVHQAYEHFTAAGIWTRLNPDSAYLEQLNPKLSLQMLEHDALTEPNNWKDIADWGFADKSGIHLVPLAAVAEMADRTEANDWSADLDSALFSFSPRLSSP